MYTIGQLSRICQVTAKALRYYEEIGLLEPARVDKFNQYRYYSAAQVEIVRQIKIARDTGMSLSLVKELLHALAKGESIAPVLNTHRSELLKEMNEINGRLARLAWWQNRMEARKVESETKYVVNLRELPAIPVVAVRKAVSNFPQGLADMFGEAMGEVVRVGAVPAGSPLVLYYDEEFNPASVDIEVAFPVADPAVTTRIIPATLAATTIHVGPYDKLEQAYAAIYGWANDNGYDSVPPMRDVYTNDPENTPPEHLVTEVILPVRKRV